ASGARRAEPLRPAALRQARRQCGARRGHPAPRSERSRSVLAQARTLCIASGIVQSLPRRAPRGGPFRAGPCRRRAAQAGERGPFRVRRPGDGFATGRIGGDRPGGTAARPFALRGSRRRARPRGRGRRGCRRRSGDLRRGPRRACRSVSSIPASRRPSRAAPLLLTTGRVSQGSEDAMRSRLAKASAAGSMQIALIDATLSARGAAQSPSLAEATRPGPDGKPVKPDERALRAVASALEPEPDLIIVGGPIATAVSRRGKGASLGDDPAAQDLIKGAVEGPSAARFATYDGKLYRIASARVPGADSAVVVGQAIDDRLATPLRNQVDADVTGLADGKVVASSLPPDRRAAVARWVRSPSPGYGTLTVRLPAVGTNLSGKLPLWTSHLGARAALVNFPDTTAQAVASVSAAPYLSWLGRYQAFYLFALALFLIAAIVWGLLLAPKVAVTRPAPAPRLHPSTPVAAGSRSDASARSRALLGADVSAPSETVKPAPPPTEVPWSAGGEDDGVVSGPTVRKLDTPLFDPFPAPSGAAAETDGQTAAVELGVGPLPAASEGGWSVGEPRGVGVEPGPASLGPA